MSIRNKVRQPLLGSAVSTIISLEDILTKTSLGGICRFIMHVNELSGRAYKPLGTNWPTPPLPE